MAMMLYYIVYLRARWWVSGEHCNTPYRPWSAWPKVSRMTNVLRGRSATRVLASNVDRSRANWSFSFLGTRFYAKCFTCILLFSYKYPVNKDRFTDESVQAHWGSQLAPGHTARKNQLFLTPIPMQ